MPRSRRGPGHDPATAVHGLPDMEGAEAMRKNCNSCQHLEWVDGEHESDTGFTCNKRHEQMWAAGREQELLDNLESDKYRARFKRCFEPEA